MKAIYLSVEEAVARLINLEYIPEGLSALEMTEAFFDDAEGAYENCKNEGMEPDQLLLLESWKEACAARHALAELLMESLVVGIQNGDADLDLSTDETTDSPIMTFESLKEWAAFRFGIHLHEAAVVDESLKGVSWADVKIKIYEGYKIRCWIRGQKIQSTFQKIGLMGAAKNEPNKLGAILIGLSRGSKFPTGKQASSANKTAISKLRYSLKELTGLADDPFTPFNQADGWKPRFELIDDRLNADKRAKDRSTTQEYDDNLNYELAETPDFVDEDDEAGDFLRNR